MLVISYHMLLIHAMIQGNVDSIVTFSLASPFGNVLASTKITLDGDFLLRASGFLVTCNTEADGRGGTLVDYAKSGKYDEVRSHQIL